MGQRIDVNHENIYYGDFLAVEDVNINLAVLINKKPELK